MTWVAAIGLTVVLAGAAAAPLLFTSSTPHSAGRVPVLTPRTLLRLPAASALAQGAGAAYVTDDRRDLLLRFDPGSGRVEGSVHLAGRPDGDGARRARPLGGRHGRQPGGRGGGAVTAHRAQRRCPGGPVGSGGARSPRLGHVGGGQRDHVHRHADRGRRDPRWTWSAGRCGSPPASVRSGSRGTADMLTYFVPPSAGTGTPKLEGITVGNGPIGVAAGAGSVWVADAKGGTVSQVDPSSLQSRAHDEVGGDPSQRRRGGGQGLRRRRHRADAAHRVPVPGARGCSRSGRRRGPCSRSADPSGWRAPIRAGCSRSRLGEPLAGRLQAWTAILMSSNDNSLVSCDAALHAVGCARDQEVACTEVTERVCGSHLQ